MAKYAIKFSKLGYFCYISHLDLVRYFTRAFKRCDIQLKHSQGFNPHPKLGFAQPLSLGYSSECELMEIETIIPFEPDKLLEKLAAGMAKGIELIECKKLKDESKSLASKVAAAEYLITIPADDAALIDMVESYLRQSRIIALKRKKKTGEYRPVNIASKIKSLKGSFAHDDYGSRFLIVAMLDAGSESNLNPELLISSFSEFTNLNIPREEISVHRTRLILR